MRTLSSLAVIAGLAAGLALSLPACAAENVPPAADAERPPAEGANSYDQYVAAIQIRILYQVEARKLAASRGMNEHVREYGNMIQQDYATFKDRLAPIAQPLGLAVPNDVDATYRQKLDALAAASGQAFDDLFIAQQVDVIHEMVNWQREFGNEYREPDIKAFRKSIDPTIQRSFAEIRDLQAARHEEQQ